MALIPNGIPEKTIERLSEYRRTLLACHREGITHIFSHVLAGIHGITAVQVRRDLMLIGFSSDTKKGYDVKVLIDFISNILDSENPVNIAVIGMGHLGQAITKYFNGKSLKLRITVAFDVDPAKVDTAIDNIPGERHLDRHRIFADQSRPRTGRADHQRRHQGRTQLYLDTPEFPARYLRGELRYYDSSGKGCLLRQGIRRE